MDLTMHDDSIYIQFQLKKQKFKTTTQDEYDSLKELLQEGKYMCLFLN